MHIAIHRSSMKNRLLFQPLVCSRTNNPANIASLCIQMFAQGGSCTSCGSDTNVRVQFATAMCANGGTTVTIAGRPAFTSPATCGQASYDGSDWTDTFLNVDQEYTVQTASNVCSTHIIFSVPAGYELEINGEKTNEINKGGPSEGDGEGTWKIVLRKCKSASLGAGESDGARLGSVAWSVGLGLLGDGRSAEKISLHQDSISAQTYTPASLIYSAPGKTNEVDVVRNPDTSLRQVKVPQTLADVVMINASEYEIRFYRPTDVGSKANGIYNVSGQPFTVWRGKNPDGSLMGRLQISKIQNGITESSEYRIDATTGAWTLSRNGGLRVETKLIANPTANSRIETTVVRDGTTQQAASKIERFFFAFPWGEEVTRETVYPYDNSASQSALVQNEATAVEIAPLVTEYAYYTDPAQGGSYSKLLSVHRPDGSWEKNFYDNFGKLSLVLRPWKDQPFETATAANSHATYYYYTNNDGLRVTLFNLQLDHVDETINGTRIRRTTYDRTSTPINGEPAVREVETVYSSGTVGVATATIKYHATASDFLAGRTALVEYPDGRRDTYVYERGDYVDNADPALRQFTPNPTGSAQRMTVIHGTTTSPNGVAFKTTKETSVQNEKGQGVLSEIFVFNGTDYERVNWSAMDYDDRSHLTQTRRSDGTISTQLWNGDLLTSQTDETGVRTTFTYDGLGRTQTRTKVGVVAGGGFPAQVDIVTTYGYDAMDRTVSETTAAGSLTLTKTRGYDVAGRIKKETDEAGLSTLYDYTSGGRIQKVTSPGGAYRVTENYPDGQAKTTTGTATVTRTYDYGVNADGTRYSHEFVGDAGAASPRWTKTTSDWADQVVKIETPGFVAGTNIIQSFSYNVKGQLQAKTLYAGSIRTVADFRYEYDELGNEIREGMDVDSNGSLAISSTDRVAERESVYEKNGSDWFRVVTSRRYLVNNDATPTSKSEKVRLTFPSDSQFSQETINVDEAGQATSTTPVDRPLYQEADPNDKHSGFRHRLGCDICKRTHSVRNTKYP